MNSMLAMLDAIHANPLVDEQTRLRAGFLAFRLRNGNPFGSSFDAIFNGLFD